MQLRSLPANAMGITILIVIPIAFWMRFIQIKLWMNRKLFANPRGFWATKGGIRIHTKQIFFVTEKTTTDHIMQVYKKIL